MATALHETSYQSLNSSTHVSKKKNSSTHIGDWTRETIIVAIIVRILSACLVSDMVRGILMKYVQR
jgi:hypothetical protein